MSNEAELTFEGDAKKGTFAASAGIGTGGIAIGALGGALASKLVNDPTKFADYVLDKGPVGIFMFLTIALAIIVWKLYTRQNIQEQRHHKELTVRDARYAQKVEELMRDQVKLAQKCTRLMAKTEVALRKLHLMEPEEEDAQDADMDEDADATKGD